MKTAIAACAVIFGAALAGCDTAKIQVAKTGVDKSSPQALATAMDRAISVKDYDGIAACVAPAYRKSFRDILAASRDYSRKMEETAALVEQRIGPAPARRIR
jgi:hypothetical protein